ncbi:MAG: hypothetical protein ABIB79_03940 [archaeon]
MEFDKVGVIGRFKPPHKGVEIMLKTLCEKANEVIIGIGSSNKYNYRNPFTVKESEEMINILLFDYKNYRIINIPDFAQLPKYRNGKRWRNYLVGKFGNLDCFISANPYVVELLRGYYKIIHPADLIPVEDQIRVKGTQIRIELAKDGNWKPLVSENIANYLEKNNLVERFQKEFGLETLASFMDVNFMCETAAKEKRYSQEV